MNNQVLKPCPFTGEIPKVERWTPKDGQHRDYAKSVWIVTIKSSAVSIEKASLDGGIDAENKAIAAWNTRAMPAPIPDAVEGVEVVGYLLTNGNQLSRMSAGKNDLPLMTVAQHNRIVSEMLAASPSAKGGE